MKKNVKNVQKSSTDIVINTAKGFAKNGIMFDGVLHVDAEGHTYIKGIEFPHEKWLGATAIFQVVKAGVSNILSNIVNKESAPESLQEILEDDNKIGVCVNTLYCAFLAAGFTPEQAKNAMVKCINSMDFCFDEEELTGYLDYSRFTY